MFSTNNNENKKLDWMYKGANSSIDREEYLLGKSVDKTLEHAQVTEKQAQKGGDILEPPKNHVEHECIPPSIRDYKQQVGEQVDLAAKLQEDPLVAIRKQEEEARKKFLQNPVQLKKIQKALEKSKKKEKVKKRKQNKNRARESDTSSSENKMESNKKLIVKLKNLNSIIADIKNPDIILAMKFSLMKDMLSETDYDEIMEGKADGMSSEEENSMLICEGNASDSSSIDNENRKNKSKRSKNSNSKFDKNQHVNYSFDSDENEIVIEKRNYGLVNADGSKLQKTYKSQKDINYALKLQKKKPDLSVYRSEKRKHLTEEEKEKLRQEMMDNAKVRCKDREQNLRKYREEDEREDKQRKRYDPDFMKKEIIKSTSSSTVASRIKSNINNIQRSSQCMNRHFSRK